MILLDISGLPHSEWFNIYCHFIYIFIYFYMPIKFIQYNGVIQNSMFLFILIVLLYLKLKLFFTCLIKRKTLFCVYNFT